MSDANNILRDSIQAEFMDAEHKYADNAKRKELLDLAGSIVQLIGFDSRSTALSALKMAERLFEGLPLTAIEDGVMEWRPFSDPEEGDDGVLYTYQAIRRPSLIKEVYKYQNGKEEVRFYDRDIVDCVNIEDPSEVLQSHVVTDMVNEMYPIKSLPYFPTKKYRAYIRINYGEDGMLTILKLMLPNGMVVDINRVFKWNAELNDWEEVQNG